MPRRYRLPACCPPAVIFSPLALLALFAGGCGSNAATVTGKVTFQGKPVTSGSVIIYCSDKQIARGLIGADGTYSIPNVPFGRSIVTVQSLTRIPEGLRLPQQLPPSSGGPIPPTVGVGEADHLIIPARYGLPEESGLSLAADRGQMTYDIDLKP